MDINYEAAERRQKRDDFEENWFDEVGKEDYREIIFNRNQTKEPDFYDER